MNYLKWNCSPNISRVLIAKNVPAEIDKKIAYTTSPEDEIIQPRPMEPTFKKACTIMRVYANFFYKFLVL